MENEQVKLYMREVSYRALQEAIRHAGPMETWYREYREPATVGPGYRELDWVLTRDALLRIEIVPTAIEITTFKRRAIIKINRHYRIVQEGEHYEKILNRVVVTFKDGEKCEMMRPLDEVVDKVKIEEFGNLVSLLG